MVREKRFELLPHTSKACTLPGYAILWFTLNKVQMNFVGNTGFEPVIFRTQNERNTRLC